MVTIQPRKQRFNLNNLPNHARRAQIAAHLDGEYRDARKIKARTTTLRVGDTVRVMRGDFKGTTGRVVGVDTRTRKVTVEGVTVAKADKTEKPKPVDPSNLVITKLDLTDAYRREKLGVTGATEDETAPKPKKQKKTTPEEATE